ncbi:hypothetical protein FJZ26_00705 [Candidatus Parvarchaeota archaeon]|nr:hypothetical protein [Candidatus Parvarchaeota archaeon]
MANYCLRLAAAIILILAASLLLFGCTQKKQGQDSPKGQWPNVDVGGQEGDDSGGGQEEVETKGLCLDSPNVLAKDSCLVALAAKDSNLTLCSYIYTTEKKDSCLKNFEQLNTSYCLQYSSQALKDDCIYNSAVGLSSINDCNLISSGEKRLSCLEALAPACESKPTEQEVARCKAMKQGKPELCPDDSCVFDLAKDKSDSQMCNSINATREAATIACKSYSTGTDYCSQEPNLVKKDYCYELWAEKSNNLTLCGRASSTYGYSDSCYLNLTLSRKDYTVCQESSAQDKRYSCYIEFAKAFGDLSPCEVISSETAKNNCYNSAASSTGRASMCNNISTYAWRRTCYSGIIQSGKLLDLFDCTQVQLEEWKGRCISTLAYQIQNKTICTFLPTSEVNECERQIG